MLTIALDEAGVFEKTSVAKKVIHVDSETTLIGGILFDDLGNKKEFKNEQNRVEQYYRAIIREANGVAEDKEYTYPEDLHVNSDRTNNAKVAVVKEAIQKTLPEFIQNGTYKGTVLLKNKKEIPERKGCYRICAIVKSEIGKQEYMSPEMAEFFKDDVAANLYYHMASEAVEHFIVRNPFYSRAETYCLDIATRTSSDIDYTDATKFVEEGHYAKGNAYKPHFELMNADVFRTILTEQILNNRARGVEIESFRVRPMFTKPKTDTSREEEKKKELLQAKSEYENKAFLYLSDAICSYITRNIAANDLNAVIKKAKVLTGSEDNLIFAYDEVDVYFRRAWQDMEIGEYFDALKEIYNIKCMNTPEAKLYEKNWVKYIEERIKYDTLKDTSIGREPYALMEAITELANVCLSNRLNPAEEKYIYEVFNRAVIAIEDKERYQKLRYLIADCGVTLYCHEGNMKGARSQFVKCQKYATAVPLEKYTNTRNRYTSALLDAFEYEEAIEAVYVTLELLGGLYDLSKEKFGTRRKNHFGKLELAKTLSQAGQIASFLRDKEAIGFFDDALKIMDDVPNRKITLSYKIHYLIDIGDKNEYLIAMQDYNQGFDSLKGQIAQMKAMIKSEDVNASYVLYMLLKGVYTFDVNGNQDVEAVKKVWDSIKELEQLVDEKRKNSHPWELIYKYYGLMAIKMGDEALARQYCNQVANFNVGNKKHSLVNYIAMLAKVDLLEELGDIEQAEKDVTKLYGYLKKNYNAFTPEGAPKEELKDKKAYIKKMFSYMYN